MPLTKIDIGAELAKGWKLFQQNMGLLIIASVIALLVSAVTCGILAGPLMAGMLLVVRRLVQNDPVKPQSGDVFKGFDYFVQALILIVLTIVASMILGMIPVIGMVAGIVIGAFLMWSMMFVAFQKLTAIDALKRVFELTKTGEFTMPLVCAMIASLISSCGAIACGVGIFFTMPIGYCMMVCCYETLFGGYGCEPEVTEAEAVPPSPPSDLRL